MARTTTPHALAAAHGRLAALAAALLLAGAPAVVAAAEAGPAPQPQPQPQPQPKAVEQTHEQAQAQAKADLEAHLVALQRANAAVLGIETTAVEDARSIATLGRERRGSGVLIGAEGLVLTIGYLVLEADHVDLVLPDAKRVPARVVAYDLATGFGLVQALAPLGLLPAPLGRSAGIADDEPLLVASGGGAAGVGLARLVSRRPFSGFWEYHIESALFTAPARPNHSGAGLFNAEGELVGVGSLIVGDAAGREAPALQGNMFVPVDLLVPILGELTARGASQGSTRAWLGVNCVETEGQVRVLKVTADSPADDAGLQPGDHIVAIDDQPVGALEALYKTLWRGEAPERDVTLQVRRGTVVQPVVVHTRDRMTTMRKAQGV